MLVLLVVVAVAGALEQLRALPAADGVVALPEEAEGSLRGGADASALGLRVLLPHLEHPPAVPPVVR